MPEKRESDIAKPAAVKKTRTRKPRTAASATSKAKSKPKAAAAKPAAKKTAKPRRRTSTKAAASAPTRKSPAKRTTKPAAATKANPQSDNPAMKQSDKPVITTVPTPKLPVSPREPAAADASSNATFSAAPVPENRWSWTGAPIAATVAFVATLGALLLGYWTGHAVGNNAVGDTAVTVASAAEKTTAQPVAEPAIPVIEPASKERNIAEAATTDGAPEPRKALESAEPEPAAGALAQGLHLQVSALSNQKAASALRERLEGQGYPVVVEAQVEDDLVRVYVGPIESDDDLDKWAGALRKEGLEPFPKRL